MRLAEFGPFTISNLIFKNSQRFSRAQNEAIPYKKKQDSSEVVKNDRQKIEELLLKGSVSKFPHSLPASFPALFYPEIATKYNIDSLLNVNLYNDTIFSINIYRDDYVGRCVENVIWTTSDSEKILLLNYDTFKITQKINRPILFFKFLKKWQTDSITQNFSSSGTVCGGYDEWLTMIIIKNEQLIEVRTLFVKKPNYSKYN